MNTINSMTDSRFRQPVEVPPLDPVIAQWALEQVRQMVCSALRNASSNAQVLLFGSWAQKKATRLSDIDVAILPQEPLPVFLLPHLREQMEESHVPYRVDIVDLSLCDSSFCERVKREGVLWSV